MKRFILLLTLLCLPSSVLAYGDKNEQYIEQFNRLLERFASSSNYKIAYENVAFVSAPMAADYISFEAPSLTLAYQGFDYKLSTRKIALMFADDDIRAVSLPSTMRLEVSPAGSTDTPALFRLNVRGLPETELMLKTSEDTGYYRFINPPNRLANNETVSIDIERLTISETTAEFGNIKFTHDISGTTEWNKVGAVDSTKLGTLLLRVVTKPLTKKKSSK